MRSGERGQPLPGPTAIPSDAAVLKPRGPMRTGHRAFECAPPGYGELFPHRAAWAAVDDGYACGGVGADPDESRFSTISAWADRITPRDVGATRERGGCGVGRALVQNSFISCKDSFYIEYMGPDGRRQRCPLRFGVGAGLRARCERAVTSFLNKPAIRCARRGFRARAQAGEEFLCECACREVTGHFSVRPGQGGRGGARSVGGGLRGRTGDVHGRARRGADSAVWVRQRLRGGCRCAECRYAELGCPKYLARPPCFWRNHRLLLVEVVPARRRPLLRASAMGSRAGCEVRMRRCWRSVQVSKGEAAEGGPILSVSVEEMLGAWKGDARKGKAREVLP